MLTGALVVVALIIGLLAVPVTLTFALAWPERARPDLRLGWAFGLVSFKVSPSRDQMDTDEKKKEKKKRRRKGAKQKKRGMRNVIAAIRHDAFRQRLIRFAGDLWKAVHAERLRMHVRTGLGDPADTGQLWALLGPVSGMLATVERADIHLEPDFVDATFAVDGSGYVRVIPLQMVYLALALLVSPPVWQGVSRLRAA